MLINGVYLIIKKMFFTCEEGNYLLQKALVTTNSVKGMDYIRDLQ